MIKALKISEDDKQKVLFVRMPNVFTIYNMQNAYQK